jgi:hypothetical protein
MPHGVNVLTLHNARIGEITAFLDPEAFGRFGLPDAIPQTARSEQHEHRHR